MAMALLLLGMALQPANSALVSRIVGKCRAGVRCCALEDAPSSVARWCVDSGESEASVMVSGATGLAEAMRDFWYVTHSMGLQGADSTSSIALAFPGWAEAAHEPAYFTRIFNHIGSCSQLSEVLGEDVLCAARHPAMRGDAPPPYPTLLLRRYDRSSDLDVDDPFDNELFGGVDPFAALEARLASEAPPPPAPVTDEQVLAETYKWVDAVIVKMKVCPFSSSVERAGLPAGGVSYPLTRATTVEELYQSFWEQVLELGQTDERTLATILLVAPEFATTSAEGYAPHTGTQPHATQPLQRVSSPGARAAHRLPSCPATRNTHSVDARPLSRPDTRAAGSTLSRTRSTRLSAASGSRSGCNWSSSTPASHFGTASSGWAPRARRPTSPGGRPIR